jgi:thiol:disulfide interchange protein DsbD
MGCSVFIGISFTFAFRYVPRMVEFPPKSGGWLNTVKVVLGFLNGFSLQILVKCGLSAKLHLLEREVFWLFDCNFGTLAFYLFGKITLPHDSPLTHISVGRLMFGLLVLTFTIYLIRTVGSTVKIISAFPPTIEYSESPNGVGDSASAFRVSFYPKVLKGPHGIVVLMIMRKDWLMPRQ